MPLKHVLLYVVHYCTVILVNYNFLANGLTNDPPRNPLNSCNPLYAHCCQARMLVLRSGLCAGQQCFFTTTLANYVPMDHAFWAQGNSPTGELHIC